MLTDEAVGMFCADLRSDEKLGLISEEASGLVFCSG